MSKPKSHVYAAVTHQQIRSVSCHNFKAVRDVFFNPLLHTQAVIQVDFAQWRCSFLSMVTYSRVLEHKPPSLPILHFSAKFFQISSTEVGGRTFCGIQWGWKCRFGLRTVSITNQDTQVLTTSSAGSGGLRSATSLRMSVHSFITSMLSTNRRYVRPGTSICVVPLVYCLQKIAAHLKQDCASLVILLVGSLSY